VRSRRRVVREEREDPIRGGGLKVEPLEVVSRRRRPRTVEGGPLGALSPAETAPRSLERTGSTHAPASATDSIFLRGRPHLRGCPVATESCLRRWYEAFVDRLIRSR